MKGIKGFEDVIAEGLNQFDIVDEKVFDFLAKVCGVTPFYDGEPDNLYQLFADPKIRRHPDDGKLHATFKTFRKHKGGYIYVGDCFYKESVERGQNEKGW